MNELIATLKDQIRSAWRFRWAAIIAAWIIAIIGWGMVFVMPDKYHSEAKVYVDTESVLRPLLQGLAVQTDLQQRLRLMSRTLLNNENLEKVMREADLDLEATTVEERQQIIDGLATEARGEIQTRSVSNMNMKIKVLKGKIEKLPVKKKPVKKRTKKK